MLTSASNPDDGPSLINRLPWPAGKFSDRICSRSADKFNNGTVVPYHRLEITVDPVLDEDDDGGRQNDGRSTACVYTVFPKIYNPPAWDQRDDGTNHTGECQGHEVCKVRMQGGKPKPLVRHDGRQVISSICKLETTTTTVSTTTTLGPAQLYTPKPGSALSSAKSSNAELSTMDWLKDPLRTIPELEDVEAELGMQWSACRIEFRGTAEECDRDSGECWPEKCTHTKNLFMSSAKLTVDALSSQASTAAQAAKTTTTIAAAAGAFVVVLVLVIGVYCTRQGAGSGAGAGQFTNASGGVIAFENPNYDFQGQQGGKYNPAYSEQFGAQDDGQGYVNEGPW